MRVLVVEDERRLAEFVSKWLAEAGYAVDVADDGDTALGWVNIVDYDVDEAPPRPYEDSCTFVASVAMPCPPAELLSR